MNDPAALAAFERMDAALEVCECDADQVWDVQAEAHAWLSGGTFDPPLPEDWSVMAQGDAGDRALVLVYGVDEGVAGMLAWYLEACDIERGHAWQVVALHVSPGRAGGVE